MFATRIVPIVLLSTALVVACGGGAGTPPADTGLILQTVIGPSCPVIQADESCPDKPISVDVRILDENGRAVASVETDQRGWAAVPLAPGDYTVEASDVSQVALPQPPAPADFHVETGVWAQVILQYDSGIR